MLSGVKAMLGVEEYCSEHSGMERTRKRQKHVPIGEFLKNPFPEEVLLDKLRRKPCFYGPETNNEEQQFMDLLVQNAQLFPTKLRYAIEEAKADAEEVDYDYDDYDDGVHHFVKKIHQDASAFFFGLPTPTDLDFDPQDFSLLESGWQGPDSSVDTPEQIELAIRIFPTILKTKLVLDPRDLEWKSLPSFFLTSAKAVPFFPLLLDLFTEFGRCDLDIVDLSSELLDNTFQRRRFRKKNTEELYEASLDALLCLREKGYLHGDDGETLDILEQFVHRALFANKSASYIEQRLRHLIEWEPDVLVLCHMSTESFLMKLFYEYNNTGESNNSGRKLERRLYEFVLEQGMLHWPKHLLGFGFHGQNLEYACQLFGKKEVDEVVNDKIKGALKKSNKKTWTQEWVLKAAMDDLITLDGLYTLIRFDPNAVMNITKNHIDPVDTIGNLVFTSYCR